MRFQGFPRAALRPVRGRVAALAAALLSATLLLSPQGAAAQDVRDFTFQNSSAWMIVSLNVSPVNRSDWGPNILSRAVPPGQSINVTFNPLHHLSGGFPGGPVPLAVQQPTG